MLIESSTMHAMRMAEPGIFCEPDFGKVADELKQKPELTAHLYWSLHEEKKGVTILAVSSRLKENSGMAWFLKATSEIAANSLTLKQIPLIRDDLEQICSLIFKGEAGLGYYRQLTNEQEKHISDLADFTLIHTENLRRQSMAHLQ